MRPFANRPSSPPTKIQIAIWCILFILTVFLSLRDYDSFQLGTWSDDSYYVVLAQSLTHSGQYGLINEPGEQPGAAPFPFGYPLLLTPLVLLFPGNLDALKALSLAATLLNVVLLFWGWPWFSRQSYWWGIAIVGLYAFSPLTIEHTRMIMSEAVFTTFCLIAMILAEQVVRGNQNRWGSLLLLSVTLALIPLIRTIGMVLVIGILGYLLFIVSIPG